MFDCDGVCSSLYLYPGQLLSAMIDRMGDKEEEPLPQKDMDGADSDEWSD